MRAIIFILQFFGIILIFDDKLISLLNYVLILWVLSFVSLILFINITFYYIAALIKENEKALKIVYKYKFLLNMYNTYKIYNLINPLEFIWIFITLITLIYITSGCLYSVFSSL